MIRGTRASYLAQTEEEPLKLTTPRLAPYAAALIAVGAAFFVRQGLVWLVGLQLPPYITFYPMVMLVALTAGFGPGILSTVTAALLAQYRILPPKYESGIQSAPDIFGLSLFIGMAVLICATVELIRITRRRATPERASAEAAARTPSSGKPLLLFVGLILSLAILTSLSGLTIRYMAAEAEADRWFSHTVSVIQELDRLVSAMKDVETGQRGYMVTRDDSYLEPYNSALGAVETGIAELQRLTRDNPRQQQRFAVLVPLIREKLSNARKLNEWRRAGGSPLAKAATDLRARGKELMDEIRRVTAEARGEEEQVLRRRAEAIAASSKNTGRALLVGDFFVLPLLAMIFFSLKQENVLRVRAETGLRRQRDRLEQQVAERTAQLVLQNERLVQEIQVRQLADESLRESEERLALALEGGRMGLWEWDTRSDHSVWNATEYQLLGLPVGEGIEAAQQFFDRVHPEDLGRLDLILADLMKNGGDLYSEFRITRADDGQERWLAVAARILWDAAGQPIKMLGVNFDITERKQGEEALKKANEELENRVAERTAELTQSLNSREREIAERQKSEERLRLLIDGARDYAIVMLDVDGRVISWNEGAKRLKGWDEKEILGRHFSLFYPEEEVVAGSPEHELGLAAAEGRYAEEGWRVRKDGSRFMADVVITAIHDDSGKLQGFSKVTRDITERQRTMEALREKEQMLILQSRLAAMGEMIGNIAHQWRQPLNTLGLSIQQLKLYYQLGEFSKEFLDLTVRSSMELIEHMSKTIDDFRNYFKPDKEKGDFKVREAIEKTLSLLEDGFRSKNISFEVIAKDDPVIHGYRNEFTQVLLNILNNASDVLTERKRIDPKVTITFGTEGECCVVTIADNAGGISEEIINRVFDPYFTTKGPQQGTGIGLYMSKTIIEKNMGGKLTVVNLADGAEFRIEVCNGHASE
jgi:PAS domain S-box-containing protein